MMAAAITKGDLKIRGVIAEHIEATIRKVQETGIQVGIDGETVNIKNDDGFKASDVKTLPYPGFPTDMQPQFTSLLSLANGTSVVSESVFENRFMHLPELRRMGADIKLEGQSAIVNGVAKLSGAPVRVTDLRAGAALLLAGLAAEGETLIEDRDHHLNRGYERLVEKFNALGADIKKA